MKKSMILISVFIFLATMIQAQEFELVSGNLDFLKSVKSINVEFSYKDMGVGKFKTEQEYINSKVNDLNSAKAGKGDKWLIDWNTKKSVLYEASFMQYFQKQLKKCNFYAGLHIKESKYTMVVHTLFFEQGWDAYLYITQASQIDVEVKFYEGSNLEHELATIKITNVRGSGGAPATAYAGAGRTMGKYLREIVSTN